MAFLRLGDMLPVMLSLWPLATATPQATWPSAFEAWYASDAKHTTGHYATDSHVGASRIVLRDGTGDHLCSAFHNATACEQLTVAGFRYLYFPNAGDCCKCCTYTTGTYECGGPVGPQWVKNLTGNLRYVGRSEILGRSCHKWSIVGLDPEHLNYYFQDVQTGLPCGIDGYNYLRTPAEPADDQYLFEAGEAELVSLVILALLRAKEPRRAHAWMQEMVKNGCCTWEHYAPELVRQRSRELRHRRGNVEEHLDLVHQLVKALAAAQNTATANDWLQYLVQCGQSPQQYPETWDAVRRKAPPQILPARLYSEERRLQPSQSYEAHQLGALEMWRDRAPLQLPALLSGESEEDRHRYLLELHDAEATAARAITPVVSRESPALEARANATGEKAAEKPVCHSQASTRAETVSRPGTADEAPSSAAFRTLRRSGPKTTSQGLQKCLEMKKRRAKIAQANEARRLCWEVAEEHRRSTAEEAEG